MLSDIGCRGTLVDNSKESCKSLPWSVFSPNSDAKRSLSTSRDNVEISVVEYVIIRMYRVYKVGGQFTLFHMPIANVS